VLFLAKSVTSVAPISALATADKVGRAQRNLEIIEVPDRQYYHALNSLVSGDLCCGGVSSDIRFQA